jgi:hypothetical protein
MGKKFAVYVIVLQPFRSLKSQVSNIESDKSQNVGLEDYNNISDKKFPYFTTPSIKANFNALLKQSALS